MKKPKEVKGSKFLEKFLKQTPQEKELYKQERLAEKAKLTLAYQLGIYVGEQIVDKYLPTLSCDTQRTRKIIQVMISEADEARRLDDVWFNKRMSVKGSDNEKSSSTEEEWKAVRAYHEMLEEKYLPKTIDCHFHSLNISENDMAEFKRGIGVTLWNCDCSHYSCNAEDIEVTEDNSVMMFTIITLKKL